MMSNLIFRPLTLLVISILICACSPQLKIPELHSKEKLFVGKRWKLRLLTSLYKPYRQYKPYVQKTISSFKIEYLSKINGEEKKLSGIVLIPHNRGKSLPIMVYCHGTMFNQNDAPSKWENAVQLEALPAMKGYITFIPDYLGYGSSQDEIPAYFDQKLTVQTISDMITEGMGFLSKNKVPYKDELFILGYSQGGHAAVSLLNELESNNKFPIKIKASVAIAAPFRLQENVKYIIEKDTFHTSAYVSYLFTSLNHRHWKRHPNEFFQGSSLDYQLKYLEKDVSLNKMSLEQSTNIKSLMNPKFLNDYLGEKELDLKKSLKDNCNFKTPPYSPLLLIHSKSDDVVPLKFSKNTWEFWIKNGADPKKVLFHTLEKANHSESALVGIPIALDFFEKFK